WSVTRGGIIYVAKEGRDWLSDVIEVYDFGSRKISRLGRLPCRVPPMNGLGRFTVSFDGRWAFTNQVDRWEFDFMMIDGFR
ncbi:MAG: hypothetical protein ACRD7E_24470, partial [Bryobacteraceae bacterium]